MEISSPTLQKCVDEHGKAIDPFGGASDNISIRSRTPRMLHDDGKNRAERWGGHCGKTQKPTNTRILKICPTQIYLILYLQNKKKHSG